MNNRLLFCGVLLALSTLSLSSCSSRDARKFYGIETPSDKLSDTALKPQRKEVVAAPWQHWSNASLGSQELLQAERYVSVGRLEEAIVSYRQAQSSASEQVFRESTLRLAGTLLKVGRPAETLTEITKYSKKLGVTPESLDPRFSLVVAYAYLAQKNYDQALAWYAVVFKTGLGKSIHAKRAESEAKKTIATLSPADFSSSSSRWAADKFVGPLFASERLRRAQGGAVVPEITQQRWFVANSYQPHLEGDASADVLTDLELKTDLSAETTNSVDVSNIVAGAPLRVGVLLPLTGRFSQHANQVKQGIELAAEDLGGVSSVQLIYADTAGDPLTAAREFARLVHQDRVSLVLGPLLVATSEEVAARGSSLNVPNISFTKKEGLPSISPQTFRLGATVSDQVREIVLYATEQEGIRSFAIISPDNSAQEEYVKEFTDVLREIPETSLAVSRYIEGDATSVQMAVERVSANPVGAVFVPGTLDQAFEVLSSIKAADFSSSIILATALWHDPVALRGYGQLIDGALFPAPFFMKSLEPAVVKFVSAYQDKFSSTPDLLSAQAYDALQFAFKATKGSDTCRGDFSQCLKQAPSYIGASGVLTIDPNGEIRRRMSVLRIYRGEIIPVMDAGKRVTYLPEEKLSH